MYNVCMTYSWRLVRRNRIWLSLLRPAASMTMTSSGSAAAADRRTGNFHTPPLSLLLTWSSAVQLHMKQISWLGQQSLDNCLSLLVFSSRENTHNLLPHYHKAFGVTQGAPESLWFCSFAASEIHQPLHHYKCLPHAHLQQCNKAGPPIWIIGHETLMWRRLGLTHLAL